MLHGSDISLVLLVKGATSLGRVSLSIDVKGGEFVDIRRVADRESITELTKGLHK
jgi:hypothetical protein